MSRIGLAFLQTLQGLSSKEEVLRIHREKEGLSREKADTIWLHYLELMVVKAHHGDSSGKKMKFSTTPEIDALWHTHLLNTESYHELMTLAREINPNLKFIHHSEENARDSEAKKEERRKAAAEAFKRTFGKECEWFKEHQEDTQVEDTQVEDTEVEDTEGEESEEVVVTKEVLKGRMQLFIKKMDTDRVWPLEVYPKDDIRTAYNLIAAKEGLPRSQQTLIFAGRRIWAGETFADHGFENGDMLEVYMEQTGC